MIGKIDPPAIGGALKALEVTANGVSVSTPSQLNRQDAALLRGVYDAIRALMPQALWDDLSARREKFQDDFFAVRR